MALGDHIQVGLGNGDLSFTFNDRFGACGTAHFFKGFADFNGDGNLDFVMPCVGDGRVGIYLGRGDGTFKQKKITVPSLRMNAAAGDFNNDGKQDFAVTAGPGGITKVWVYLGDGTGSFAPAPGAPFGAGYTSGNQFTTFLEVGDFASAYKTWGLVSGDWNNDGKRDLAVAGGDPNVIPGKLTLLLHS